MINKETLALFEDHERLKEHPILLLGGTGNVGTGLAAGLRNDLGSESIVVASRNSQVRCDITNFDDLCNLVERVKPSLIYHLCAATDVNRCEADPDWAWEVNFDGTSNLLRAAKGVPVVMFSTDFVFDGEGDDTKKESDHPHPQSVYGLSKYAAECLFLDSDNPGFILRISYPWYRYLAHEGMGVKDTPYWMVKTLNEGSDITAYKNVIGNWTSMTHLSVNFVGICEKMFRHGQKIMHLGGRPHTAYEVASALVRALSVNGQRHGKVLEARLRHVENQIAMRPARGGMNTELSNSMGIYFPDIIEEIDSGNYFK